MTPPVFSGEAFSPELESLLNVLEKLVAKLGNDRKQRHQYMDMEYCTLLLHQVGAYLYFLINRYEKYDQAGDLLIDSRYFKFISVIARMGNSIHPSDKLGFSILDAIRGDRVRVNDRELEVTSSAHLIAKSDDEPDLFGFYGVDEDGQEYRVTVKPDISDSDSYVEETEIVRIGYSGGIIEGNVVSFGFSERSSGSRMELDRYVGTFEEQREEKGD